MPFRPKHPCAHPGCPELVESGQKYCEKHRSGDRGIQGIPRLRAAPSSFSSTITNTARTSGRFPARIVLRLRGRNDLSFQLSVGHAFNMTRGPSTIGP